MKIKRGIALFAAVCLSGGIFVSACTNKPSDEGGEKPDETIGETLPDFNYKTYDNVSFSNYYDGGELICENPPAQWAGNGMGDPFVFRFNGMYYLYVSTRSITVGVRGWKSRDLINWEQCTGEGLETGFVSEDSCLGHAYAPEVYYFNGKFYMYTSPDDKGHYTLEADSPEGPFTRITGNYGMVIDGTMFIDDDETFYFLNASHEGLQIHHMDSPASVPGPATVLRKTNIGWTEGPMIIKRNGTYFLTYTGPQVMSPCYRVLYNTESDGNPLVTENSFARQSNTPLLLATEDDYKGLGHSSTVLGPDLDSYYLVYHNLHAVGSFGCWRGFNFDRLIFNGTTMSVDGSAERSIAPALPAFSADGESAFTDVGGKKLTSSETGKVFSAEYNFTGDKVKCIAGYRDENNYVYVLCDYENHRIALYSVKNGSESLVSEGELIHDFVPDRIHTVRFAYADGVADVYFDNMCKISNAEISVTGGRIGYQGGTICFTAFSDVARGYSDKVEMKLSGTDIGSVNYLPEDKYENLTSYKLSDPNPVTAYTATLSNDNCYDGANKLKLLNGDFARYSVYFREKGTYALKLTYDKKYGGKQVGIQLNLDEVVNVTLPDIQAEGCNVVSAVITDLKIRKNANLITIHGLSDSVEIISFTFAETGEGEIDESLTDWADGSYETNYDISSEGHSTTNTRMATLFGQTRFTDCEVSVDIKLGAMNGKSAGIIVRADNPSLAQWDDVTCVRGYYVGFKQNELTLDRYDFNYSATGLRKDTFIFSSGTWVNLKITLIQNTLTVYINGSEAFSYTDGNAFASGYCGLYSDGAEVTYKNFKATSL